MLFAVAELKDNAPSMSRVVWLLLLEVNVSLFDLLVVRDAVVLVLLLSVLLTLCVSEADSDVLSESVFAKLNEFDLLEEFVALRES